jgi:hypothetical protein
VAEEPNYLSHAFKSQYNLIGLVTAAGFAVIGASLLPAHRGRGRGDDRAAPGGGQRRFQRLVRARTTEEEEQTQQRRRSSRPRRCSST